MASSLLIWVKTAIVLAALLVPGSSVLAQADESTPSTFGITVSPVVDEFTSNPGTTTERTIKITNPIQEVVTLYPVVLNFYSDNDKGQPTFYSLEERNSRYALSNWVTFAKPLIRVAPGEVEEFMYTVKVPIDAEPGGRYGGVLFSTKPPVTATTESKENKVSVVGLVGSLVLHTVPGEVKQTTDISDFSAPSVLVRPPANLSLTFQNSGNVHTKPTGQIKIRNMFGQVVTSLKVNEGNGAVLPDSSRTFEASWKFDWKQAGKYTATAVITYGVPEQSLTSVRTFYIVPLWLVAIIVLLALWIGWKLLMRRRGKRPPKDVPPPTAPLPPTTPPEPKRPTFVMR